MALIVELFGPPGSGKTTFAKALVRRLRAGGVEARTQLSARPGEDEPAASGARQLGRIARPLRELAAITLRRDRHASAAASSALRPYDLGAVRRLRLRQYLLRLHAHWTQAQAQSGIVVFDQAYLQFVATLFAHQGDLDRQHVADALSGLPSPDFALRLDAASAVLGERLRVRLDRMGPVGRWFEAGTEAGPRYEQACVWIAEDLRAAGRAVLNARSLADGSFTREVERVVGQIRFSPLSARRAG